MIKFIYTFAFLLIFQLSNLQLSAQDNLQIRDVVTNLDTPWEILWGADSHIWMTERYGRISRVNPETGELTELITISDVFESGERGLLGMALDPDFFTLIPENFMPYVYVVYNYGDANDTKIKIVRFHYNGTTLDEPVTLLDNINGASIHDGSRIWIDPNDRTLYVSIGDAGDMSRAQNLDVLNGKILRMNLDGSIPDDNPFTGSYVWSYGHRNPQGLVYVKGRLISSEHGPSTDDEINIIQKGHNYGWPNVAGYCDNAEEAAFCQENNVTEPIAAWTPTLATAGIDYYSGNLIPEWNNSLLLTTLKASKLVQLKLNEEGDQIVDQNIFFQNQFGRLRDICISPDGRVFISTSNLDGRGSPKANDDRIIEITPKIADVNETAYTDFEIYPNPAKDYFVIKSVNFSNNENYTFKVVNSIGEQIFENKLNNSEQMQISTKGLPSGIYTVYITNGKISNAYNISVSK